MADSNRRPTHYECVALPTEPQWQNAYFLAFDILHLSKAAAKVLLFFKSHKFFGIFFVYILKKEYFCTQIYEKINRNTVFDARL